MSDPLPAHSAWNVQLALVCVDGCEPELRELLEIWLQQAPRLMGDIRSALEHDEPDKLHLAAHTLKGSLQILRADQASSYAAELEAAGQKRQTSSAARLLSKLEDEIAIIIRLVTDYMDSR